MKRKHIILLVLLVLALCVSTYSAEFLIYNKDHWCDALSQKQIDEYVKKYPKFMDKYNARTQRGDVIEVRPDGYWTGPKAPGYDTSVFLVVTKPGMSYEDAKHYSESLEGLETFTQVWLKKEQKFVAVSETKKLKSHKYSFSNVVDKQVINDFSEITITEKGIFSAKEIIDILVAVPLLSLLFS